ncbi:MAG: hypothetical protein CM1200mP2_08940 [Planctomycetaceae bacterium]|nr:MAG: hypothetical protein CM1200mP2_08940 [Planctomycetaceae bacterium]
MIAEVLGEMAAESEASNASVAVPDELGESLEDDGEITSDGAEVESDVEDLGKGGKRVRWRTERMSHEALDVVVGSDG